MQLQKKEHKMEDEHTEKLVFRCIPFMVNDSPYCAWEATQAGTSLAAVNGISPEYFEYLVELYAPSVEADSIPTHAAVALRTAYAHALETLFAVMFAGLQAPEAIYAWLHRYRTEELVALVQRVSSGEEFHHSWLVKLNSWKDVVGLVLSRMPVELMSQSGTRLTREEVIEGFSCTLSHFARDMVSQSFRDEYNDAKHGMRLLAGGFSLAFSKEDSSGVPSDEVHVLCVERCGSSAYKVEQIPGAKHHLRVVQHSRNWRPVADIQKLHLATCWLACVKSWLRVALGAEDPPAKWNWIANKSEYEEPWRTGPAIPEMTWTLGTVEPNNPMSKEEIIAVFESKKQRRAELAASSATKS
jgi:hypothetical protein